MARGVFNMLHNLVIHALAPGSHDNGGLRARWHQEVNSAPEKGHGEAKDSLIVKLVRNQGSTRFSARNLGVA